MDERQTIIKDQIVAALTSSQSDEMSYKSEWLGFLPFGVYHWIEHDGIDISRNFPAGWTLEDLAGLEQAGFLRILETWSNPHDEFERHIRYRVSVERM